MSTNPVSATNAATAQYDAIIGAAASPYLWCSDCRTALRAHYFALNDERPVCGKCRPGYAAKIARGTGASAVGRAFAYGMGAALAGAAVVAVLTVTFGFLRIFCAIAVGYAVAKAVNAATGEYYSRRYQVLAVGLTYFALGLGCLAPVIKAYASMDERPRPTPAVVANDAQDDEAEGHDAQALDESEEDPVAELEAAAEARASAATRTRARGPEERMAERLASGGTFMLVRTVITLLLSLPLLSLFTFGIYGAVIGLWAFGFGMYKAWDITGRGVTYTLTGPHRVGAGPIAPAR